MSTRGKLHGLSTFSCNQAVTHGQSEREKQQQEAKAEALKAEQANETVVEEIEVVKAKAVNTEQASL